MSGKKYGYKGGPDSPWVALMVPTPGLVARPCRLKDPGT
jgi:hypothetical protein